MKIGERARLTDGPVETIRYYEREGLLPEPSRSEGNYRQYTQAHVERLAFIRHCRSLDMTQQEIRELLRLRDSPEADCTAANRLIDDFQKNGRTELLASFADIIPVTMIARMIGIPEDMGPQLLKWSHDYVGMYMFKRTRTDEEAADRSAKEFADYVREVI
eukprot:gene50385-61643_t